MSSEWRSMTLGDVTTWMSGGTPKKDDKRYWGGEIPWISASSMHGSRYVSSDLKLTQEGLVNGSRLAPKGSILLLVRGSALHSKIPVGMAMCDLAFNQDVKALLPKIECLRPWFLLYWLMSKESHLLDSVVEFTGIGAGKLDTKRMQSLEIKLPSLNTQDNIISVAKSLDDRITLLRETNKTLESIAQAIFKSWFVDFDPVHAKAKGLAPEGMDEATAALFPDSFEETELGTVPKGWKVKRLGDITDRITKGTTPTTLNKRFIESGVNFIKVESITEAGELLIEKFAHIDVETHNLLKRSQLEIGDILVTIAGTIGRIAEVSKDHVPANTNQAVALIRPIYETMPGGMIKRFLHQKESRQGMRAKVVQAVQANLSLGSLSDMPIVVPPNDVSVQLYERVLSSLDMSVKNNRQKIRSLSGLRDTLLPRLISGQLRVEEAQEMVESV
jgi:type I restriction enzyme S subunit